LLSLALFLLLLFFLGFGFYLFLVCFGRDFAVAWQLREVRVCAPLSLFA